MQPQPQHPGNGPAGPNYHGAGAFQNFIYDRLQVPPQAIAIASGIGGAIKTSADVLGTAATLTNAAVATKDYVCSTTGLCGTSGDYVPEFKDAQEEIEYFLRETADPEEGKAYKRRKVSEGPPNSQSSTTVGLAVINVPLDSTKLGYRTELKWFDETVGSYGDSTRTVYIYTHPYFYALNGIASGSGPSERTGAVVTNYSLEVVVNLAVGSGSLTGNYPSLVRLTCLYDKQANGTLPEDSAVFMDPGTLDPWINSFYNLENSRRFTILWDKIIPVNISSGYLNALHVKTDLKQLKTVYDDEKFDDVPMMTGAIYVAVSSSGTNVLRLILKSRLRFRG